MENNLRPVIITGVGSYLPEKIMNNHDLEAIVDTSDQWIRERTGIVERRISAEDQASSDLAVKAAEKALEKAGLKAEDLDLIIVGTTSPDMAFPSTGCFVQEKLGARKVASFDLAAACSGFIYALSVGKQFVASGMYNRVLIIGVDVLTKMVDWEDRNTCVLFGDGAGAVILEPGPKGYGLLSTKMGSDGSLGRLLTMSAGGSRFPLTEERIANKDHTLKMAGREVFKHAVRNMAAATNDALAECGLTAEDVDLLIPHQANIRILTATADRIGIPHEKVFINIEKYANTSAATIPIALDEAVSSGRIKTGDIVVFVAFGGGLTWGANVIRWSDKAEISDKV
jgi:3-oxoacyl-[acyl-carrier-protein] synthase III